MTEKHDNSSGMDKALDQAIHDTMRLGGWVLPKFPKEIERSEQLMAEEPVKLPQGLADPFAILSRPSRRPRFSVPLPESASGSAEQNLARAAREGGDIPPEVQEQMAKDRKASKGKANG